MTPDEVKDVKYWAAQIANTKDEKVLEAAARKLLPILKKALGE